MSSLRACSSSSSRVLTPRFLVITSSPSGWGSSGLCDSSGGVRVGLRLHLCGQGLRLALRCSGARFHCRARLCAATSLWARIALASPWFWSSCSLPCAWVLCRARWCADTSIWARIALVSPCFWCSCLLPYVTSSAPLPRVGVRIRPYGQGLRLSLRVSGARVHCRM